MSRIPTFSVGAVAVLAMTAATFTAAEAAPLPVRSTASVAGDRVGAERVGWRRGYGYRRGYGGRAAGALAAGAALGIIGGAIAASTAPRYGYYGGYGYPAYGYGYAPAYGYGYAPAYGYPYAW